MRLPKLSLTLLALALVGCGKNLTRTVEKAGDDLVTTSQNLQKVTANIDPMGLKKLLDENAQLRENLEEISRKYQAAMGSGALVVSQQAVYWRVTDYSGALRLTTSINSGGAPIVLSESELPNRSASLGFQAYWFLFQKRPKELGAYWSHGIDGRLQAYVDGLFAATTKALPVPVAAAPAEIWLNPRFPGSGLHNVTVEVLPRTLNSGKWHVVWELVSKDPDNKNEKVLASYNMNQDVCKDVASRCSRDATVRVDVVTVGQTSGGK